jgi:uncharacterized protein YheU (UPF0270 family)
MSSVDSTASPQEPVEVPVSELAPDVLVALVESFVLREGTDYGPREFTLEEKVREVIRQLERREALIMFDPETESVTILPRQGTSGRTAA